ncbi:hypothetical protein C8Q76DRAFT_392766 [Earliella scabrosa]|nr:hypothetical protein C8Q76DRAFT_392766 [Earliella scabrosa]
MSSRERGRDHSWGPRTRTLDSDSDMIMIVRAQMNGTREFNLRLHRPSTICHHSLISRPLESGRPQPPAPCSRPVSPPPAVSARCRSLISRRALHAAYLRTRPMHVNCQLSIVAYPPHVPCPASHVPSPVSPCPLKRPRPRPTGRSLPPISAPLQTSPPQTPRKIRVRTDLSLCNGYAWPAY